MKKLLTSLLFVGAMALTSCAATNFKADDAEKKLSGKEYSVSRYSGEDVPTNIAGFDYTDQNVLDAVLATKGSGDDSDFFLAFYFKTSGESESFMKNGGNANLASLNNIAQSAAIGRNLKSKLGTYNNVCYVTSETAYAIVF